MKRYLILMLTLACSIAVSLPSQAGTLSELAAALQSHYAAGEISDADVKATLDDLLGKASAAVDVEAENAYRGALIDVVNAFTGIGISSGAAANLVILAQP